MLQSLDTAGVAYALCGGLAANIYGADRFTKDIDLLVAPGDLDEDPRFLERIERTRRSIGSGKGTKLEDLAE